MTKSIANDAQSTGLPAIISRAAQAFVNYSKPSPLFRKSTMRFASLACFVAAVSAFELPASVSRRSILAAAPAVFAGVPAAFAEKDNAGYQRIGTMHKEGNQYLKSAVRGMRAVNIPKLAHATPTS